MNAKWLRFAAAGLLLFLSASAAHTRPAAQAQPAPRYNLISIVTDDQAVWSVGAYGNREAITPNQDRLAREGAKFLNAFVATPVCSPSRVAFLTGLYGTQVGITDWISPEEGAAGMGLPPGTPTWPRELQRHGYRTGLFGKWHLGARAQFHPTKHGFDEFMGAAEGSFAPMNPTLEVNGQRTPLKGAASDLVMDAALRFIETNRDKPFATLIHFREPHTPYGPMPDEDIAPFKDLDPTVPSASGLDVKRVKQWHREYYAAVHAVDRNLGKLLAKLEALQLADKTIVLFTSDHGYNIGHHGVHSKGNAIWIAGGVNGPTRPNMWDTSLRIPLLIRWPGVVKPGSEITEPVLNLDTFASVLGMLGLKMPAGVKQAGADFSPLLRMQKVAWRDTIYGQYDLHHVGLAFMRMIRTQHWKLVRHYQSDGLDELYDLQNDPGETRNLYDNEKHRAVRDDLQGKLAAWQRSLHDPQIRTNAK